MAVSSSLSGDVSFRKVLSFVRTHREAILERFEPAGFCLARVEDGDHPEFVAEARALVASLEPDVQDYAISSAYARMIRGEVRKALSAYFTPPALAAATLAAIAELADPA
jgi:adenine-specific DNA-methyltransferase